MFSPSQVQLISTDICLVSIALLVILNLVVCPKTTIRSVKMSELLKCSVLFLAVSTLAMPQDDKGKDNVLTENG